MVDVEMTLGTKDGRQLPISLSLSAMQSKDGEPLGIVCIGRDLTERKRSEQALKESNRRLEETLAELRHAQRQIVQQERLRALELMASGIAHNLNNALLPVLGYSELLLDRPENLDDKEAVTRRLQTINQAAKDAANVVRRLGEFYRPRDEQMPFLPIDVTHLLNEVIDLTQSTWKDQAQAEGVSIDVVTDFQPVPCVDGNEAELREVVANLILNAVDAMPEGGTLTLRCRLDGQHIVIEVGDTGVGMADDVRVRVLEPFFTTKGHRGTGLGLALSYGVIQRHGGTIDVQSELGVGTTIILRLPIDGGGQAGDTATGSELPYPIRQSR